jgi:hypothetical protein
MIFDHLHNARQYHRICSSVEIPLFVFPVQDLVTAAQPTAIRGGEVKIASDNALQTSATVSAFKPFHLVWRIA